MKKVTLGLSCIIEGTATDKETPGEVSERFFMQVTDLFDKTSTKDMRITAIETRVNLKKKRKK